MVYDETGGGTGTLEARYFHGEGTDEVLSFWEPGEAMRWAWSDRLGSVRDVVETNGSTVTGIKNLRYNSFGQITGTFGTDPSLEFRVLPAGVPERFFADCYRGWFPDTGGRRWLDEGVARFPGRWHEDESALKPGGGIGHRGLESRTDFGRWL